MICVGLGHMTPWVPAVSKVRDIHCASHSVRASIANIKEIDSQLMVCICVQRSMLQSSQSSYDSMYEEANNLLKNLHFQRLMRHGPDSPEPAEKGTLSMS